MINQSSFTVFMKILKIIQNNITVFWIQSNIKEIMIQLESIYKSTDKYFVLLLKVIKYKEWISAEKCINVINIIEIWY